MLLAIASLALVRSPQGPLPPGLQQIANKYSVEVVALSQPYVYHGPDYKVEADPVSPIALERYLRIFVDEWNRYPVSLIAKAHLQKIVIGSQVRMNGQVRASVPAFEGNLMVYDAELGAFSPPYQRNVIHHEFFHFLDERMGTLWKDPAWKALNPKGFKYGHGGARMRTKGVGILSDSLAGLLTPYAGSGPEEDKAETFSHLLVDPDFVAKRAAADPVLAVKIATLKQRLAAYDPELDDSFWKSRPNPGMVQLVVRKSRMVAGV